MFESLITDFMFNRLGELKREIYNERSLQFEFGKYINEHIDTPYRIYFEFNTKKYAPKLYATNDGNNHEKMHKRDIDIAIVENETLVAAIELKCPQIGDGAYPKHMYKFLTDIRFIGQLIEKGLCKEAYAITLTDDTSYWEYKRKYKDEPKKVYKIFRNFNEVRGTIDNPTGDEAEGNLKLEFGEPKESLIIKWNDVDWNEKQTAPRTRMYIVKSIKDKQAALVQKCIENPIRQITKL